MSKKSRSSRRTRKHATASASAAQGQARVTTMDIRPDYARAGIILLAAVMAIIMLLALVGCGEKPTGDSSAQSTPATSSVDDALTDNSRVDASVGVPATGDADAMVPEGFVGCPFVDDNERMEMLSLFYQSNHGLPEFLGSTMSAFPTATWECLKESDLLTETDWVDTTEPEDAVSDAGTAVKTQEQLLVEVMACCGDAAALDDLMSTAENGGEIQKVLLNKLLELLSDPTTEIELYTFTGEAQRYNFTYRDIVPTPENVGVALEDYEARENQILVISVNYPDGTREVGYFDADAAYWRMIPGKAG